MVTLLLVLRLLTIGTVTALLALMLHVGEPARLDWWLGAIPFAFWIIGPAVTAYVCARNYADRLWFTYVMMAYLVLSAAVSAASYYQAFFVSTRSTSALIMVVMPFFQWMALACVGLISAGVAVSLDRRSIATDA